VAVRELPVYANVKVGSGCAKVTVGNLLGHAKMTGALSGRDRSTHCPLKKNFRLNWR